METLDCFDLHYPMLNDDDDIQDAYCKLYNFCMKSFENGFCRKISGFSKNSISRISIDRIWFDRPQTEWPIVIEIN